MVTMAELLNLPKIETFFEGMIFAHCVTGSEIVVVEVLEHHCIVRLRSGKLEKFSKSQLQIWKPKTESVTAKAANDKSVTGQSVTAKAANDKSVTLSPVKQCAACGKQCSPRAKTCSPKCRKKLSRMSR